VGASAAYYKSALFGSLNVRAARENPSPNGYCEFPCNYPDGYYAQLTNSEKMAGGGFKDIGSHEALDCRVYNLCLSDAWLESQVKHCRDEYRAKGWDAARLGLEINSRTVLEKLRNAINAYEAQMQKNRRRQGMTKTEELKKLHALKEKILDEMAGAAAGLQSVQRRAPRDLMEWLKEVDKKIALLERQLGGGDLRTFGTDRYA